MKSLKIIIDIQCVRIKYIWTFFAKNLNDFNIQLFGQNVYYYVSPSSNVPFDPLGSEKPPNFTRYFSYFIIAPKKLKLDFILVQQNESFDLKRFQGKQRQTTESTTNS